VVDGNAVSRWGPVAIAFALLLLAGILAAYVATGWRAGIYKGRGGGRIERRSAPRAFVLVAIVSSLAAAGTFVVAVLVLLEGLRGTTP
jgi:hypothetical protein